MTLQQLNYFCALAKSQHYTKTAESLGISQPSLSYAITELEKELGFKLFDRISRRVVLNSKGKVFYHYVQESLSALENGKKALVQVEEAFSTTLTIGYLHSISTNLLPEFIKRFHQANTNPDLHINFVQGVSTELERDLLDGTIDLMISVQKPNAAISFAVGEQPLCLYVPAKHPLATKKEIDLSEAMTEPLILVNTQTGLRFQIDKALKELNTTPQIAFEANSCDVVMKYVSQGYGIAILPQSDPIPGAPTKEIKIIHPSLSRTIYVSYMPTLHVSPDMQEALDNVLSEFSKTLHQIRL